NEGGAPVGEARLLRVRQAGERDHVARRAVVARSGRDERTRIAGVADAVEVAVALVRVVDQRAVVDRTDVARGPAAVAVGGGTGVAGVADAVVVAVALVGVVDQRAVVARVTDPVAVAVGLVGVPDLGAVVDRARVAAEAGIAEAVAVGVGARVVVVWDA